MPKINFKICTEEELWKYVATHLKKSGIGTVLVGGAVVSVYSRGAYRSGDLDFVKESILEHDFDKAMKEIGFEKGGGRHYIHPECGHLFVEVCGGPPLGIGEDNNIIPAEIENDGVTIKIYSPTDCIKDRLASYIYFNDNESLDQALLVAKNQSINLSEIKRWCNNENQPEVFREFTKRYKVR